MAKKLFKEKQYFLRSDLKWIAGALGLLALLIVIREYLNPDFQMQPSDLIAGILTAGLILAAAWFLMRLKIKTTITEKGIEYKMFPFHNKKHIIPWDNIRQIRVLDIPRNSSWQDNYNSYMLQKKFTFSGRRGISVLTCDGEQIFIGSAKIEDLKNALEKATSKYDLPVCA